MAYQEGYRPLRFRRSVNQRLVELQSSQASYFSYARTASSV